MINKTSVQEIPAVKNASVEQENDYKRVIAKDMSVVIKAENLSKQYKLGSIGTGTISHDINRWWYKIRGKDDPYLQIEEHKDRMIQQNGDYIWALKDVNFEVKEGEVIGIIGRNGAGKSTLLKILSRTTSPTLGNVKIRGRVASLLEVGTGFHPDLTGRENVFLNGSIMGMTRAEVKNKFNEIVEFSGVERYIDTPVKRYSSGMYVRLAFGVAAHLQSEILIVDEVLAVGDTEFQKRCIGKMDEVSKGGRTVLFVSHQMGTIAQLCNTCILMNQGGIVKKGTTKSIIETYMKMQLSNKEYYKANIKEVEHKSAYFIYQKMIDEQGDIVTEISNNDPIILEMKICIKKWYDQLELSLSLQHRIKGRVFTVNKLLKELMSATEKEKMIKFYIPANTITPNHYSWISSIHIPGSQLIDVLWDECSFAITDAGTEFARYEGVDYGVFRLANYNITAH